MNAIEALRPVTRVLQLFGLSAMPPCEQIKSILFKRIIKCYSILLFTLRIAVFFSISMESGYYFQTDFHKIGYLVSKTQLYSIFMLEIIILVEALVKAHKEKQFMKNLTEIDGILMHHFDIDLKMKELKRAAVKQLMIWICVIGVISVRFIVSQYNTKAYFQCLTYSISIFTTSLTYYQIILWTALVRCRLHTLNRLISKLNIEQFQRTQSSSMNTLRCESAHSNFDPAYEAHILNQFDIIYDLYNRMWTLTNLINIRFKYSMILHIGADFVFAVANAYFTFLCLTKYSSCDLFALNVTGIIASIFYVSSLSIAGQSMSNEALQIAFEIHRNRHARKDIGLSSFVCGKYFHIIKFQSLLPEFIRKKLCILF